MNRDADCSSLIRDRSRDRLANPPRGVRREFVTSAIFVLVDSSHQPAVTFLDEVQKTEATVAVLLGDRHNESQVSAGEVLHCEFVLGEAGFDSADALP